MPVAAWLIVTAALGGTLSCAGASAQLRAGRIGAEQQGMASYYSPHLAGHRTASGERYQPAELTAAHPVLPFGTRVLVTRLDGDQRSVVVRINDRCAGRRKIIDLSDAAARRLGMKRAGLVPVRIQVVARE